jgi:hypothetical protein
MAADNSRPACVYSRQMPAIHRDALVSMAPRANDGDINHGG